MSDKPQIFLLGASVPGLEGPLERLTDVGYGLTNLAVMGDGQKGVAVLAIGRETDIAKLEPELTKLRNAHPDQEWIAIFSGRLKVKLHHLHAMGFGSIFQIPLDEELFTNRIFELVPLMISQKELKFDHLLRVNLPLLREVDLAPFDVFIFLPSNRKIMLYFRDGLPIEKNQIERIDRNKNYSLFIRKSEIAKYKKFASSVLLRIKGSPSLSDQEKIVYIQENIQQLMMPFFTEGEMGDEEGKQTVKQLQEMLRGLQIAPNLAEDVMVSLEKLASQKMTNASHSNNVATYCALFGVALGMLNLDELRLGGLLHDLGLADLPNELLGRDERKMSKEDRARYHLHPGNGRTDVINRKVPVTDTVLNIVLLHHERPDGSGYPYGKKKDEIPVEAQICAFADEFDKLTSLREGYLCYSAKEALLLLSGKLGEPASSVFNPDVHQPIIDFYLKTPEIADGKNESLGEVSVRGRPGTVERKKFAKPILINDLIPHMPPRTENQIPVPADVEFEIMALEKEIEFYFFEKKS